MSQRLFGTDGVRGRAGDPPLDAPTVRRLGAALVRALPRAASQHHLLIGRDTRESGGWIARELAHGARSEGGVVTSAGVISTPAIAYLTRESHYDAGVVISASHNPFEDNGIKVFSGVGEKFTERLEREIEEVVADASWQVPDGEAAALPDEDISRRVPRSRAGRRCPRRRRLRRPARRPSTAPTAPRPSSRRGCFATSGSTSSRPAARRTAATSTSACGSTHPEPLAATVVEQGCRLGIAFDGDGDRAIFVDHRGRDRGRRRDHAALRPATCSRSAG